MLPEYVQLKFEGRRFEIVIDRDQVKGSRFVSLEVHVGDQWREPTENQATKLILAINFKEEPKEDSKPRANMMKANDMPIIANQFTKNVSAAADQ